MSCCAVTAMGEDYLCLVLHVDAIVYIAAWTVALTFVRGMVVEAV